MSPRDELVLVAACVGGFFAVLASVVIWHA